MVFAGESLLTAQSQLGHKALIQVCGLNLGLLSFEAGMNKQLWEDLRVTPLQVHLWPFAMVM